MEIEFDFHTTKRLPCITSPNLSEIREIFSAEDKNQVFLRRRLGRNIPTRKYAINNIGCFDAPFFETLCDTIRNKFPSARIKVSEKLNSELNTKNLAETYLPLNLTPREYQDETVKEALKQGKGVIVLPTSAGKTLVIGLLANTLVRAKGMKVLILVPDIQLVQQTFKDFGDYGISPELFSRWTGSHEYESTEIVIANNQILLSEKQDLSVLKTFDVVIVDECHKCASAQKISKLIKKMNCKHVFGFTGSLPEAEFDVWTINRIFGPVIYRLKSIELRDASHISQVRVVALELEHKQVPEFAIPSMADPTAGYIEEIEWLQSCKFRNDLIQKLLSRLNTNTLVLVDRIAHGEYLLEYLSACMPDRQIYFIQGSVEVEEREKLRQQMEAETGIICIAISKIFSTGISIKNLHNIIFAAIGKARIKIIQSIGRSLRLHASKTIATIFDIADTNLRYGLDHFEKRKEIYKSEKIPVIHTKVVEKGIV